MFYRALNKIGVIFSFVFLVFSSSPALAGSFPFHYEEVIIEHPTCPFYYYEIAGQPARSPCPYGTKHAGDKEGYIQIDKAAAGNCHFEVCDNQGICTPKDEFMGADEVPIDYKGGVVQNRNEGKPWRDPDLACVLVYSKDTQTNTYCNLLTDHQDREYCYSITPHNLNVYWIIYYAKIAIPLLLGLILCVWFRKSPSRAAMWLVVAVEVSLISVFSNDAWKMDNSSNFVYYTMILPVLTLITLFYKKSWLPYVLTILNILAILMLGLMIILPAT